MKFHTLTIHNFLTIGEAVVHLKDKGLHLIQGINDDNTSAISNGAGKSSVVDALSWVLFGVTNRGTKGDRVVNRERKKECSVLLTIEHGDNLYKVERYRKHSTGKNSLRLYAMSPDPMAASTDLTKGTDAETQKDVEALLGCSLEVFRAAVYCGQKNMPDLPAKTDKELKMLVEEAAGLKRIEKAYEIARDRLTTAKGDATIAQTRLDATVTSITRVENSLVLTREEVRSWEEGRDLRVSAASELVTKVTTELRSQGAAVIAAKPAYESAKLRIAAIDTELANHGTLNAAAVAAERDFNRLNLAIDRAGLTRAQDKLTAIKFCIDNVDVAMAEPCKECGKPHTAGERVAYLEHQDKLLVNATRDLGLKRASVAAQAAAAAEAKKKAEAARAVVPDVTAINTERLGLAHTVRVYEDAMTALKRLKDNLTAAQNTLALRETEVNPKASTVTMLEGQLDELTGVRAAQQVALDEALAKLEVAEHVVKVFGPAGVRAQILDSVTPFLNAQTADYLSVLTDGNSQAVWTTLTKSAAGDLKEKFSIVVTDAQGADDYEGLSGGEQKKVQVATALALQDLTASRATQAIDLWIGDEIDEALDAAGTERLMTILERKSRERGTVIAISHNELRDWIDNVTVVTKKDKVSTVEGSLCA